MRAFIAAYPDQPSLGRLIQLVEAVVTACDGQARPMPAQNLHLTLRFFGMVKGTDLPALRLAVKGFADSHGIITLAPTALRLMPPSQPRMVWLAFEADDRLAACHQQLRDLPIGPQAGKGVSFFPHITLARSGRKGLPRALPLPACPSGPVRFDRVCLIRSHLGEPGGARHEVLHERQLHP